jgi:hypothetical protein
MVLDTGVIRTHAVGFLQSRDVQPIFRGLYQFNGFIGHVFTRH